MVVRAQRAAALQRALPRGLPASRLLAGALAAAAVAMVALPSSTAAVPPPPPASAIPADASLVVHLIPHSHCDPGWLESFQGYYFSSVSRILSSVVGALSESDSRRFVWAETSFLMRWYEVQPQEVKRKFQGLVASGRLEFVGGGWVQNDEANPTPDAVVSQLTEGHEYLQTMFGAKPRVAWSIDPFGSSSLTPAVAAAAGYDALVINRIDYTVKDALKARAGLEFIWTPSAGESVMAYSTGNSSAGAGGGCIGDGSSLTACAEAAPRVASSSSSASSAAPPSIFTHVLHSHYSAPEGFDFENGGVPHIVPTNVGMRAQMLAGALKGRAGAYRTRHLLVPFGDDFKFQDAGLQFRNMDQLVDWINARNGLSGGSASDPAFSGIHMRYSTLSEYFDAVWRETSAEGANSSDEEGGSETPPYPFPVYAPPTALDGGVDFFPYADNHRSWWVGYFTSRPALKALIARLHNALKGADALLALARPWAGVWQETVADAGKHIRRLLGRGSASGATDSDDAAAAASAAPYGKVSWMALFQRLEAARLDAALCLHHDAITGTSRSSVVDDYTARMSAGIAAAEGAVSDAASLLLGGLPWALNASAAAGGGGAGLPRPVSLAPAPLTHVPHVLPITESIALGVTIAPTGTEEAAAPALTVAPGAPAHPVTAFNPTPWKRRHVLSVAVDVGSDQRDALAQLRDDDSGATAASLRCRFTSWPHAVVTDANGTPLPASWRLIAEDGGVGDTAAGQAAKSTAAVDARSARGSAPPEDGQPLGPDDLPLLRRMRYELVWEAELPALGLATFFVSTFWGGQVAVTTGGGGGAPAAVALPPCAKPDALAALARATGGARLLAATPPTVLVSAKAALASKPAPPGVVALAAAPERIPSPEGPDAAPSDTLVMENACLIVEVDAASGLLKALTRKAPAGGGPPVRVPVAQTLERYKTLESGAYLFRPINPPEGIYQRVGDGSSVSVSATLGGAGSGAVGQSVRVVGPRYSLSLRLQDTLGWASAPAGAAPDAAWAASCANPLHPDAELEVRASTTADTNEEVILVLDVGVAAGAGAGAGGLQTSVNSRDNIDGARTEAAPATLGSSSADAQSGLPTGWWTSDGWTLLRRAVPPRGLAWTSIQRHYFPGSVLSRVAGAVISRGGDDDENSGAKSAWASLTVHSAQPGGVAVTQPRDDGGVRLEVMIHRNLQNDDGRGLADGVHDRTTVHPRFTLHLAAAAASKSSGAATSAAVNNAVAVDWDWGWAARVARLQQPPAVLHADLSRLAAEAAAAPAPPAADTEGESDDADAAAAAGAARRAGLGTWAPLPPLDPTEGTSVASAFSMAETALPRSAWTSRFQSSYAPLANVGLASNGDEGSGGLPGWVHLSSLFVRDGTSDDVVMRLRNTAAGGSLASPLLLDAASLLSASGSASPLALTSLRARSLSLLHEAAYTELAAGATGKGRRAHPGPGIAQLAFRPPALPASAATSPLDTLLGTLQASPDAVRADLSSRLSSLKAAALAARVAAGGGGGASNGGSKQNTEEEGVFISDAALAKLKKDREKAAGGGGGGVELGVGARKLLAAAAGEEGGEGGAAPLADAAALRRKHKKKGRKGKKKGRKGGAKAPREPLVPEQPEEGGHTWLALDGAAGYRASHAVVALPPRTTVSFLLSLEPAGSAAGEGSGVAAAVAAAPAAAAAPAVKRAQAPAKAPPAAPPAPPAKAAAKAEPKTGDGEEEGEEEEGHGFDAQGRAKHPGNEALAHVKSLVKGLVTDPARKAAMLATLARGEPLSPADQRELQRLERKPNRPHNQPEPEDLEARVAKAAAEKAAAAAAGAGAADGAEAAAPKLPQPVPLPAAEAAAAEEEEAAAPAGGAAPVPLAPLPVALPQPEGEGAAAPAGGAAPGERLVEAGVLDEPPIRGLEPRLEPAAAPTRKRRALPRVVAGLLGRRGSDDASTPGDLDSHLLLPLMLMGSVVLGLCMCSSRILRCVRRPRGGAGAPGAVGGSGSAAAAVEVLPLLAPDRGGALFGGPVIRKDL